MNLAKYLHKRFLGQIFSSFFVTQHAHEEGEEGRPVPAQQELERSCVTMPVRG